MLLIRYILTMLSTSFVGSLKSRNYFFGLKASKSLLLSAAVTLGSKSITNVSNNVCTNSDQVLQKFKLQLLSEGLDAFIIPTDDPHLSEYTAPYYARREFISGFTGSAGTALVTLDKAYLFTDGRYHNQAELELNRENWTLMKVGLKDVPNLSDYLSNLKTGSIVGVDPFLHSASEYSRLSELLKPKGIQIKPVSKNLVDSIWDHQIRPSPPTGDLRIHAFEYAGKNVTEKLKDLREKMLTKNSTAIVAASLDEIAWLFNIRGCDVPCNPVSVSYALVTVDGAFLFIDDRKVPKEVRDYLEEFKVKILPYEDVKSMIIQESNRVNSKIWIDSKKVNYALYSLVNATSRIEADSPLVLMKAIKNEAELRGMRDCHLRDGAAMSEFFCWLENHLKNHAEGITEVDLDAKLTDFRKSYGAFDLSFPTIAGVASNGAIIHYRAEEKSCKTLTSNDIILLDSGGQYYDGTTDVTRTFHTGAPSNYFKEMFTRVLKGHIGIDSRVFPVGTAGCLLDSFAREHLWSIGKDFLHGVGHGVGAALNVHEGPQSISRTLSATQPLVPGMIISNEPGYYEDGNFGIRIENLLVVVKKENLGEYRGRSFLGFSRLTHIPIQKKMIDTSMLTKQELMWINTYHAEVREKVMPLMRTPEAKVWLESATSLLESEIS